MTDIINTISLILSTLSIIILFRNWQNNNLSNNTINNFKSTLQQNNNNDSSISNNIKVKRSEFNKSFKRELENYEENNEYEDINEKQLHINLQKQQAEEHCKCCCNKQSSQPIMPSSTSIIAENGSSTPLSNFMGTGLDSLIDSPMNNRLNLLQSDDYSSIRASPSLSGYTGGSDEDSNSPQLAKSFLSPLNFTTGPKQFNKKNQSYYVSTYYSSCEVPDYETIPEDDDEPIVSANDTKKAINKKKKSCILPQILQLRWKNPPKKVLVIHKNCDNEVLEAAKIVVKYLIDMKITTFLESEIIHEIPTAQSLEEVKDPYSIDFIISMGGDGTVLHTSSLFKTYIPPILSFNMGSLGFLTTFDYPNYKEHIYRVIEGKCFVSYRLRLSCTVVSGTSYKTYQVLNEVAIDRGNNPYLSNLECTCDDKLITMVQADGLIIATSTGSTAYSLSAGGSLVHPTIPAMLITPICPHTLSFRPIILPSTSTLIIKVSDSSRCTAWASFDGRNRQEIKQGDSVIIRTSKWAVPVICKTDESNEWFEKLATNLNWNVRLMQKSFSSN